MDSQKMGVQLTCRAILLLAITCSAPAPAAAEVRPVCTGRAVRAADGSASGLDDCALADVLRRAALREHLAVCARALRSARERVFGGFAFSFRLYPDGGVSDVRIQPSAFDRTGLTECLRRVLQRRLRGGRRGKPALVEGRFALHQEAERGFSYTLTSALVEVVRSPPPPLPGGFAREDAGWLSWCPLGEGRLGLRLVPRRTPVHPAPAVADPLAPGVHAVSLVDGCELALREDRPEGWSRREWKKARKQACACLEGLLEHTELDVRATAAERLARGRYWSGRRALTAALHGMLGIEGNGRSNGGSDVGTGAEQIARVPAGVEPGLATVRMVWAHLRLRRWIRDGILEALARHPARMVRAQLLSRILDSRHQEMVPALRVLLCDPDPVVRARACNLGCQRDDRDSLRVFLSDLASARPVIQAAALVYARDCARWAARQVREAAVEEPDPLVALLMLEALPDPPAGLVEKRAGDELFNPCPARRFIAARLLGRFSERPAEVLRQALGRERDPALRAQLESLLDHPAAPPPARYEVRLWLQR